jgi:peptidoglycan hydrolase-like protein with peptidoglycan-binding domain
MNGNVSRTVTVTVVVLAVAAGATGVAGANGYGPLAGRGQGQATPAPVAVPLGTATVRLGTLSVREYDAGTIGYADPQTVYYAGSGTCTWLPAAGAVIRPGGRLLAVDGQDVLLLRGATPAWRAFAPGMTDGSDVAELQRNLISLGYDPYRAITVDGSYDWDTQVAVERWQAVLGLTLDAQLPLGQVVFLPGGPVRVAQPLTATGAALSASTQVLAVTSTTPLIAVSLQGGEQAEVKPGQRVTITLPDGAAAPGRITSVTTGAPASAGGGNGSGSSGPSGSGGAASPPQVTAMVAAGPAVAAYAGASVQVAITTARQPGALIVPIAALLADQGGGYQVTVVAGRRGRPVTVEPGLFDDVDGLVSITGPGIGPGTVVEVPQS